MTIIITGANRGLGYEAVKIMAAEPSRTIVLTGRDLHGLQQAAQRIRSITGNENLVPMPLNLASLDSVRAFSAQYKGLNLPPLKTIICNAGISKPTARERSVDGYEITFATNHLAHFLLVNLLIDALQAPARILFVSSGAHDPIQANGPMQPPRYIKAAWLAYPERDPNLPARNAVAGGQAYASSKLCNLLCAYELARRLETSKLSIPELPITVNAYDPGLVAGTGLGRDEKAWMRFTWYHLLPVISRVFKFGRSSAQAGTDLAYLATAPELRSVTGQYFIGRKVAASSAESYDLGKAADLWSTSIALSRLRLDESPLLRQQAA